MVRWWASLDRRRLRRRGEHQEQAGEGCDPPGSRHGYRYAPGHGTDDLPEARAEVLLSPRRAAGEALLDELPTKGGVNPEPLDLVRDVLGAVRIHEQCCVADLLGHRVDVGDDERTPDGHGLERRDVGGADERHEDRAKGLPVEGGHVLVRDEAEDT